MKSSTTNQRNTMPLRYDPVTQYINKQEPVRFIVHFSFFPSYPAPLPPKSIFQLPISSEKKM
jgi:hypothetical protein